MVISFKPKSKFLKKYVKDFSTFEKGSDLKINFATFPHTGPGIAFFRNARLHVKNKHLQIDPTSNNHFNSIIIGKYTKPVYITYSGYVDEISVNFKPLGVNYFFSKPYNVLAPENFQKLNDIIWLKFGLSVVSEKKIDKKLNMFEDFLIKQFRDPGLQHLQNAVDMLMDRENEYKVSEAAETAGMTERSLHRWFLKYIGCTPVMFRRIVRFRNAIDADDLRKNFPIITRLGYENQFYDSAHFARDFKFFTAKSPKSFFKDVEFLGNSDYPYIFL